MAALSKQQTQNKKKFFKTKNNLCLKLYKNCGTEESYIRASYKAKNRLTRERS